MTTDQIARLRQLAIEEVRQALKWQDWSIGCVAIVDRVCENLQQKLPDNRYKVDL